MHFLNPGLPQKMGVAAAALSADQDTIWMGMTLPKRHARRAVRRNLIRRLAYACAASHLPAPGAYLLRLHRSFDRARYPSASSVALRQAVRAELQELFRRVPVP